MDVIDVTVATEPLTLAYLYLVGPGVGLVAVAVAEGPPGDLSVAFSVDAPVALRRAGYGKVASLRAAEEWAIRVAFEHGVDLKRPSQIAWTSRLLCVPEDSK